MVVETHQMLLHGRILLLIHAVLCLQVPITLYFMTHAYFCFYHALSNVVLRRTTHAVQSLPPFVQWLVLATVVFVLAYITALMETVTIAHFPYYKFKVRQSADGCLWCSPVLALHLVVGWNMQLQLHCA